MQGERFHFWSLLNTDIYGLADISVHGLPDSAASWQTQSSDTFSPAGRALRTSSQTPEGTSVCREFEFFEFLYMRRKKKKNWDFIPPLTEMGNIKGAPSYWFERGVLLGTGNSPGLSQGKQTLLLRQKWSRTEELGDSFEQICPKTSPWETKLTQTNTHAQAHTPLNQQLSPGHKDGRGAPAGWERPHLIGWNSRAPSWCRSATGDSNHASFPQDKQRTHLFIHLPSIIMLSHLKCLKKTLLILICRQQLDFIFVTASELLVLWKWISVRQEITARPSRSSTIAFSPSVSTNPGWKASSRCPSFFHVLPVQTRAEKRGVSPDWSLRHGRGRPRQQYKLSGFNSHKINWKMWFFWAGVFHFFNPHEK